MGKEFGLHLEDDGEPWRVLSRGVVQIDLYLRKVVLAAVWSGGGQRRASKWRVLQHLGERSLGTGAELWEWTWIEVDRFRT